MAPSALSTEIITQVPEDGFDDSEFTDYSEGNGKLERARSLPVEFARRISSIVEEALSRCQSIVGKSSQTFNVLTGDLKDDTLAMDYIETECSESLKSDTEYIAIRNIVTGGAADSWYPNSSPGTAMPPPLSLPVTSPHSFLGVALCFGPLVPIPIPATACEVAANRMIERSVDCNATATQGVSAEIEATKQTTPEAPTASLTQSPTTSPTWSPTRSPTEARFLATTPVSKRTPLRSAAALFQPATVGKEEKNLIKEAAPKTTLMFRNLPTGLTRDEVMNMLRSEGFADHVVFIYLPLNLRAPGNFGYAFVDFDSMASAEQCKDNLERFSGWDAADEKVLEIAWSETQGIDSHIQRYRDSPIMHPDLEDAFKPALFKNGTRIAFPHPTKPIRAPRLRKDRSSQ